MSLFQAQETVLGEVGVLLITTVEYKRITETGQCTCGMILRVRNERHLLGVFHQKAQLVLELLETDINHSQIAERLGISRERVRQIVERLELPSGRERAVATSLNRAVQDWALDPLIQKLTAAIKPYGLLVSPIPAANTLGLRHKKRLVIINGWVCQLLRATWRGHLQHVNIRSPHPIQGDFVLYYLTAKEMWFVVPVQYLPSIATGFSLDPTLPGGNNRRHDWLDYENAWDSLKEAKIY